MRDPTNEQVVATFSAATKSMAKNSTDSAQKATQLRSSLAKARGKLAAVKKEVHSQAAGNNQPNPIYYVP